MFGLFVRIGLIVPGSRPRCTLAASVWSMVGNQYLGEPTVSIAHHLCKDVWPLESAAKPWLAT